MTSDEQWLALLHHDASCDGRFFYAVRTTGIFCRPSCKSKTPKQDNVVFFDTAEQAKGAGFRACKRCRSDLPLYQPMKDLVEKAKQLLDDSFQKQMEMDAELRALGLSRHRMSVLFKEMYGVSLSEYWVGLRLMESKRLLCETTDDILDIAFTVGFGGISSFYRSFKKNTGTSPAAYRKEHQK